MRERKRRCEGLEGKGLKRWRRYGRAGGFGRERGDGGEDGADRWVCGVRLAGGLHRQWEKGERGSNGSG
jgi:hypothetical protein